MNDQRDIKALILTLVGSGTSHPLLRGRIADSAPRVSHQKLEGALVELHLAGALHQLHGEIDVFWAVGSGEQELLEGVSPEVIEQILKPGEFVEIDVDQFLAELDAMIAQALKQ